METLIIPEVGMGATQGAGSDCYPYTIHRVSENKKSIWVSSDNYRPIGGPRPYGMDGEYEYSNDHGADETQWTEYTLRKNGRYIMRGQSINSRALSIGFRRFYNDPSF